MKKLFFLLLLLVPFARSYSQCNLLPNAVAGMTLVHQNTNCFNNSGVAYNPILGLYYGVRAGNPTFPLETWTSAGVPLFQTSAGFDWRGMWWNPLTNQLEGNGYSTSGTWVADLNGSGWALNTGVTAVAGMNQPDAQSCGDFDCIANEVLYYFNGVISRYSRPTGAFFGSYPITGTPVALTNLNSTTLMFTGCPGKEIALLDYVNKAVYVYNKATGAYVGTSQLPVAAITTTSFRTSWANCLVWLFDVNTYTWFSYQIFDSCSPMCSICPPVFTSQSFTICSGSSMLLGGALQTTSGIYTDSLTTVSGCDSIVTSTLTVTPLPAVTVNSPTICTGQTANLSAGGGTTYTWSAGATSTGVNTADATPAVTTTYTVTGTTTGCSGTAVATVTVVPSLVVTVDSPTICAGQTANLSAGGANTYSWSAGATSTGITTADATPLVTTTYTVTGTSGACSATAVSTVTVNSNPVVTVNSPTICVGQTANLIAAGATTYTWSAGATSTGITTADATPVATTTYTVTGTTGTCTGTAVATVTVNPGPVVTVNSPAICTGQTASLLAGGATTYTWSAGATSTGITTADATPAVTTTYTVTGTTGTCTGTAVSTVTVNPNPVVTVNSPTICIGGTANLVAGGATTYTWSAGATSTGTNTAGASPAATTTYTVTGTTGTCTGTAVATVTIAANLSVTVNSPSVCAGQAATLTAGGANTYTWSAGATSTGITTASATPLVTTSYTVTGTSGTCTGTAVATVTVNSNPVVTVNSPTICAGQTANLIAGGATTYTWSAGATSTGITTANASPASTTTYTVTGTTGSCSGTAIATVTVNPLPVVTLTANPTTICSGQAATLTANGATIYTWSAGATSTGVNTATASPTVATTYIVTGTTAGCSSTASTTVSVNNCVPPVANLSGYPLTICNNGCVTFIDLSLYSPTNWQWLFPGGVPANSNSPGPVSVCYSAVGQYPVTLIVSNAQGSDTITMINYVNIVAPIPFTITGDLMVNACEPAVLTAVPPGTTYLWGPPNNLSCSTCQEAIVTPFVSSSYYCEYTDINGCSAADTVTVDVLQNYNYLMPTGFSPNGDKINDVLFVKGIGVEFIELKIYDRVGEMVFQTTDLLQGWDGTYLGQPMNDGEFVYTLEVTYCNQQVVKEQGSVMLSR